MFGRATITLGIGPHSSYDCFAVCGLLPLVLCISCSFYIQATGIFTLTLALTLILNKYSINFLFFILCFRFFLSSATIKLLQHSV